MAPLVAVHPDETIDGFAGRWNLGVQQVVDLNQQVPRLKGKQVGKSTEEQRKKWLGGVDELNVPDGAEERPEERAAGAAPVAAPAPPPRPPAPGPIPDPLEDAGLRNENRDWLTYETLFNLRCFRKTNQACQPGLYLLPLSRARIWVRDWPPDELQELVDAFFPDSAKEDVLRLSESHCPWKARAGPPLAARRVAEVVASRRVGHLLHTPCAVMPFNHDDNYPGAAAIGAQRKTASGTRLALIDPNRTHWRFWKTASRSLVVELGRVKARNAGWGAVVKPEECRRFRSQANDAGEFPWWSDGSAPTTPETDGQLLQAGLGAKERAGHAPFASVQGAGSSQLRREDIRGKWGVKTGAQFVGFVDQGALKGCLEEESVVACLRSDLIAAIDRERGGDCAQDPQLGILTELLAITEDLSASGDQGDGIQVRDFRALDPGKIYFPPTSIPFVDRDLRALRHKFACVRDPNWVAFWQRHYAEELGRAKARLLLRYGLQMLSPNAQNFLLEFDPPQGPDDPPAFRRVLIRDVGDMYLHREALWARFGPPDRRPPVPVPSIAEAKDRRSARVAAEKARLDAEEARQAAAKGGGAAAAKAAGDAEDQATVARIAAEAAAAAFESSDAAGLKQAVQDATRAARRAGERKKDALRPAGARAGRTARGAGAKAAQAAEEAAAAAGEVRRAARQALGAAQEAREKAATDLKTARAKATEAHGAWLEAEVAFRTVQRCEQAAQAEAQKAVTDAARASALAARQALDGAKGDYQRHPPAAPSVEEVVNEAAIAVYLAPSLATIRSSLAGLHPLIRYECTTLPDGPGKWREELPYETGTIKLHSGYGQSGTQFMWHQFSTLAKGSSVAFASPKGKDADSRHDAWRETCAAMCAWGIAHDRAYVDHLEQELGWQSGIEWDPGRPGGPPGPERYLALHVDGSPPDLPRGGKEDSWKWAETCYGDDLAWEEGAAARVHAFLASDEGQRALRAYHR